jgi:hypothetical protein
MRASAASCGRSEAIASAPPIKAAPSKTFSTLLLSLPSRPDPNRVMIMAC